MPRLLAALATAVLVQAPAIAQEEPEFLNPETRGQAGSIFAQWDVMRSPDENFPDVDLVFDGIVIDLDAGVPADPADDGIWSGYNAFDSGRPDNFSFSTTTGNIYSFAGVVEPRVEFTSFGQGYGFKTTILYQFRTIGNFPDLSSVTLLEQTEPVNEFDIFFDPDIGGGFGGVEVVYAFEFQIPRDRPVNRIDFSAVGSSMSFTRALLDIFVEPMECPVDLTLDGEVNFLDMLVMLRDADFEGTEFGSGALGDGDWNGDGFHNPADLIEYMEDMDLGCS